MVIGKTKCKKQKFGLFVFKAYIRICK